MAIYITENKGFVGPEIEAWDFTDAEQQAEKLGVEVVGEHVLTISRDGFTDVDADEMCKALSESYNFERW